MARLPYLRPEDLAPADRDLLARDIHLARLLAHAPDGARRMNAFAMWIRRESSLDARLRELAILQVGWCARNAYEWSHHVKIAREAGVPDHDIHAIATETAGGASALDSVTRTVLRGAREAAVQGAMAAGTVSELRSALGEQALMELIMSVSFYCGVVRLLASVGIEVEADYQPYLDAFPLPEQ